MPTQQLASSQISTQYRNRPIYRVPVAPYQFQARGPERFGAVRMGPPYLNGMNISLDPPIPAPPRQKGPFSCQVTNRHRLFGPGMYFFHSFDVQGFSSLLSFCKAHKVLVTLISSPCLTLGCYCQ